MKAAFLAVAVLATAGVVFYFSTTVRAAKASGPVSAEQRSAEQTSDAHKALASKALSIPLFFEPNQGQTAPPVKFVARGSGYGLFLTADEAVLQLQRAVANPRTATAIPEHPASSVIRMKLDGANSAARVSGAEPLPGKSNYFIGNDPAKWRRNIPQFARVQYKSVYPGVDLVYYGDQGQLEYDFRVAPTADPNQIALTFQGASPRLDAGDLVLSTANGDVRFHAPHIYQPAAPRNFQENSGSAETAVAGCFRQLADNKIGFAIANYDHSRELVIDPVLSYSTYLGGAGTEGLVKIAVDGIGRIYVAGSTNSAYFFPLLADPPIQGKLLGAQNIFIAVIDPNQTPTSQLIYATYLGGSGLDSLAGVAVDSAFSIYVAGSTTSSNFPTTPSNALLTSATGAHGFLSRISLDSLNSTYSLGYSTYLAGNGVDTVTGLAIDASQQYAYVTGVTTSTNVESDAAPFPANSKGFQTSNDNGTPLFFASQINTTGTRTGSMIYSTYFGGANFAGGITLAGGGIAVDTTPSNVSMYFTGTTNMLQTTGPNGEAGFPLRNAQQACLDEASTTSCSPTKPINPDAFLAKINPNPSGGFGASSLVYSTYLGGSGSDTGVAVAVDSSSNAYVIGSTNSTDWASAGGGFQTGLGGGFDAFIAKIGNLNGSGVYPLNYFTYLGGELDDFGQDIKVDGVQTVYVTGSTTSQQFPTTANTYQKTNNGLQDAFVAAISTTLSGRGLGDFSTYLGGSQQDQGTGVAVDIFGATYVAGTTQSAPSSTIPFPITPTTAFQTQMNGPQDAFVSKIGSSSKLLLMTPTTSPAPNPVAAGAQVAFTFDILNTGPDAASNVVFTANVPSSGLVVGSIPSAKVTQGTGTCGAISGNTITCTIPTLAVCVAPCTPGTAVEAAVEVDLIPAINTGNKTVSVSANVSANGGATQAIGSQTANVVDFTVTASPQFQSINNGDVANFVITFQPSSNLGYTATITPTQSTSPSMVTSGNPTFTPTTVQLSGAGSATTTLSIATVARPVTTGNLLRRGSFYTTWLPVGGLSLVGLGIGVGRKRRRWLVGIVFALVASAILLQSGCGSSSSSINPSGGTQAGTYSITIHGSAAAAAAHDTLVHLQVN
jgi:hypothetical protein